jgi:hypothetical protein
MLAMSETFRRHATSPLLGIATLFIGLACVALFSVHVSHLPEARPTFKPVELPLPPAVEKPEPSVETKQAIRHDPTVVQSAIVHFPQHGAVRVESIEQVGEFPKIVIADVKDHAVLYHNVITDPDGSLKPRDDEFAQPCLRFREIISPGFPSPLIMAVAVTPGGSDTGSYLAIFGETNGKFERLTNNLIGTAIQGGFYLGFLNRKFGYGLISWCFDWNFDASEGHYDYHHYLMEIYLLRNGRFRKVFSSMSRRRYLPEQSSRPLHELGIKVKDLRKTMPKVKEYADAEA